jgi:Lar family restriction alleviation protein
MRYIEPDKFDINLIVEGRLRGCPFCGNRLAVIINRVNDSAEIFRSIISCSRCDAQTSFNARNLDEARQGAITRWNTRVAPSSEHWQYFDWPIILREAVERRHQHRQTATAVKRAESPEMDSLDYWCAWVAHANAAACLLEPAEKS